MRLLFFSAALPLSIAAGGCAGTHVADLRPGIATRGHYIEGVPFVRQSEQTCGPAALAGVFQFWGRPVDLNTITTAVYVPKLGGTLPTDMERFAAQSGFRTAAPDGTLASLKQFIRKDIPVICLLDLGFSLYQKPHYVTVIGFDDVHEVLIEHDGVKPDSVISYEAFSTAWERAGRWMLVIMPQTSDPKP